MILQFFSSPACNFGSMFPGHIFKSLAFLQSTPLIPFDPVHTGSGVSAAVSSSSVVAFLAGSGSGPY